MNINYIRVGDYFIPDLTLPEELRPMGKWGRMHREYLREYKPIQYNCALCRDHERNGFLHGVQLGAQLVQEIQSVS